MICEDTGAGSSPSRAQIFFSIAGAGGKSADGAGELAHAHLLRRVGQALGVALVFGVPDGELAAEGDGLGVDAVRAAHHGRVLELERALLQDFAQPVQSFEQ